jgi:hypothetical protein
MCFLCQSAEEKITFEIISDDKIEEQPEKTKKS